MFAAGQTARAEVAANVDFVAGLVTAVASGHPERELAKDSDIHEGDRIDTSGNGRVQLRFTDGGLVSLMPLTTFSVDEYRQAGQPEGEASLVFGMLRGGMRTITGTIGKARPESYELKTPVATLGIRGTEYVAVLNPPNTLRVHVGRGKVVITNEYGSLDVPSGRNAVVTLGGAPALSEQGPLYLAAGPGGDRLVAEGEIRQDPYLNQPLLDLPLQVVFAQPGSNSPGGAIPASPVDPVVPGPVVPEPIAPDPGIPDPGIPDPGIPPVTPAILSDGPGYAVASIAGSIGWVPWVASGSGSGLDGTFSSTDGALLGLVDTGAMSDIVTPGDFQVANVETVDALSWGEFTNGAGYLNGVFEDPGPNQYLPYVVGLASIDIAPANVMFEYSLEGATAVRGMGGVEGQLDKFDLGINLGTNNYTLDAALSVPGQTYRVESAGAFAGGVDGFIFSADPGAGDIIAGGTPCSSCSFDVSGFLAGPGADQAGVAYDLGDSSADNTFSGAAGLRRH